MPEQQVTPEHLAQIQALVDQNPQIQAIVRDPKLDPRGKMYRLQQLQGSQSGAPENYLIHPDGQVKIRQGLDWKSYLAIYASLATLGTTAAMGVGPFASTAAQGGANAGSKAASSAFGTVPEGTVDDIPAVFGPGATEHASDYPFLSGGGAGGAITDVAKNVASRAGTGAAESSPDWLKAAFAGLAGLPGMMNSGPSDEERGYQAQATRLLGQQEQRTQFQNPLYEAVTKMAHGLLPNMGNNGQPYPLGGLNDVKVPTLEDLIAKQRRA